MKILAIDTTGGVASVAVVNREKTLGEFTLNHQMNHSVTVLPMVDQMLSMLQMTLADMDYIACASGPGSFTGLRIGGATAKALAHGANKPIVPVPTLDAMAYNVLDNSRLIVPIMDARRNQVYAGLYRRNGGRLVTVHAAVCEEFDAILALAEKEDSEILFLGDGIFVHKEQILAAGHSIAGGNLNLQRAASVGALAVNLIDDGKTAAYDGLELTYLRKPQAEREYERKRLT